MGAAGKNGQRSKVSVDGLRACSKSLSQRSASPDPVLMAGKKIPVKAGKILRDRIKRLLNDVGDHDAIKETVNVVDRVLRLISRRDKNDALREALNYELPPSYFIGVALTIAQMNPDYLRASIPDKGAAVDTKISRKLGKKALQDWANQQHKNNVIVCMRRVETIITALLQEHVAHGVVTPEELAVLLCPNAHAVNLINEISRITALHIRLRKPDEKGRLRVADVKDHKEQALRAQDLVWLTRNPARTAILKATDALQRLRFILARVTDMGPANKSALKTLLIENALHIHDMYLPIVRDMGWRDFQEEMQDLFLQIIDPIAYKKIRDRLDQIATAAKSNEASNKIMLALKEAGFNIKDIAKIFGRRKTVYSFWKKILDDKFDTEFKAWEKKCGGDFDKALARGDRGELIAFSKLGEADRDIHSVYDGMGFRVVIKDVYDKDGTIDHNQNHLNLRKLAGTLCRLYEAVPDRKRDYISGEDKENGYLGEIKANGYKAIHITVYMDAKSELSKRLLCEIQLTTESYEAANNPTHSEYKADGNRGLLQQSYLYYIADQERNTYKADTIERIAARMQGGQYKDHLPRSYLLWGDQEGNLYPEKLGNTVGDLICEVASCGGQFRNNMGVLVDIKNDILFEKQYEAVVRTFLPEKLPAWGDLLTHPFNAKFLHLPRKALSVWARRPEGKPFIPATTVLRCVIDGGK